MGAQIEDWLAVLKTLDVATAGLSGIPVFADDLIRLQLGLTRESVFDGVAELARKKYVRVFYTNRVPDIIEVTKAGRKFLIQTAK
ncbi:hypothetical protein [Burkholderia perseverans]|uniref:hypothetical protein n=1 Tax=Burkholderia perseverans TaxID=2615214 RepID=UPI001FEF7962|nr:hypothetical protein [Burkholderia perseverans]